VVHPEFGPGFDLWVGGGLSTNPMLGRRLGAWVPLDEVPDVWHGVIRIFRDYGYRRLRARARLKFLMADWGPEKFREVLEKEYLGRALPDGPAPDQSPTHRDHIGVEEQVDGRFAIGGTTKSGRTSGTTLRELAELSDRHAKGRVRLTAQQGVVVLDVPADAIETVVAEMDQLGYAVRPSAFRRGTIACTGIEFCKLALVETKQRAESVRTELERRLPDFDTPITINVNGCPNSCARFQVADIGLKGMAVGDSETFQVHLGGQMGTEAEFGRKFRGLKVTAEEAPDYIERVLNGYLERREGGEAFASYVSRADEAWLL
jgi:sulfite reductase (ferredoxin)